MLKSWSKFEKIWLVVFLTLIIATTVVFSVNGTDYNSLHSILLIWVVSPISAITGILCVVLVARGSIWNYSWGVINCISYGVFGISIWVLWRYDIKRILFSSFSVHRFYMVEEASKKREQ